MTAPAAAAPADASGEFPGLRSALAGQFRLERELGRGGMGVVWLVRDLKLDRLAALKVLPPALAARPAVRERFVREARTAGRLAHPNIVPVYRADEAAGTAFFVMAYVEGESLGDRVRDRGPLPPAEAVRVLREVAWALAYAHARGVVHRDVKPENILLERPAHGAPPGAAGRALVTDFGIAHRPDAEDARLTGDGQVLGTLHYMSPEQASGQPLDGRSDLYALGVVAFYVLSGRLPFDDVVGPAVLVAHATRPAPPLAGRAPGVPAALAAVVDRCLAKEPDDRYPTGEALAEALERALAGAPAARDPGPQFPADVPAVLSEAEAAALWRRAAQLQAEALQRLDARRDLAAPRAPAAPQDGAPPPTSGYRVAHVASAAEEAGISRQFVAMALAELPRDGRLPASTRDALGVSERQATRFLGTDARSLAVSQVVPAAPARALRALGSVLRGAPFELRLRETVGAHPLDGGVLVFDLPGPIVYVAEPGKTFNGYWMGTHHQLEARRVQVTLRAVPGPAPGVEHTEVTMTCDLRPGVRRNVRASQWIAGVVGGSGGLVTGALAAKGAVAAASLAVLGPAAGVGLGLGGLVVAWYRWLYPSAVRKARGEMLGALDAVAASVRSDDVFGGTAT